MRARILLLRGGLIECIIFLKPWCYSYFLTAKMFTLTSLPVNLCYQLREAGEYPKDRRRRNISSQEKRSHSDVLKYIFNYYMRIRGYGNVSHRNLTFPRLI